MEKLLNIVEQLQKRFFDTVVSNNLVYNTCWEDPRVDRDLLNLDANSRVVMLSSAGCNALDYLLDDVHQIHCVDSNPAQNALLELKKALFKNGNYQLLWDFFGAGQKQGAELIYHRQLRPVLPDRARSYWNQHIGSFIPTSNQPSFYFSGTSGKFAHLIHRRIQRQGLQQAIQSLLNAQSLKEQTYYFDEIEPQLWNPFTKWLIRQPATMAMLGVPATQQQMIEDEYEGGLIQFIRSSIRKVFTTQPIGDNYFWHVYLTGSYAPDCCPNYLLERNFAPLVRRVNRIDTHTTSLLDFLKRNPGNYSHFVLLDHQDWLAYTQPDLLAKEWTQILSNAQQGARILFRSAGATLDFLPDFVFKAVEFRPKLTAQAHQRDRVGTYEATHLGVVK
ncbi:MAG: BtaA family protein [Fodinibius sp.]|nr:BtaA family protein [Fodinibius sp.]